MRVPKGTPLRETQRTVCDLFTLTELGIAVLADSEPNEKQENIVDGSFKKSCPLGEC